MKHAEGKHAESAPPWTHAVSVAQLPAGESTLDLAPSPAALKALAAHAGVLDVPELAAHLVLVPDGRGGARVSGRLTARVVQACVVTLEPVEGAIDEQVSLRFSPGGGREPAKPGAEVEIPHQGEDPPEPVRDGAIDLGATLTELLVLAIDPYPRKPGAAFDPGAVAAPEQSPFAALAKLKDGGMS